MEINIGKIVREYRESVGCSQRDFAKLLKSSQTVIKDIELGGPVSKAMAKKLAPLTGVPIEKFILVEKQKAV